MIVKNKYKNILSKIVLYTFMIAMVLFTSLPLIYVAVTAFKPMDELFLYPPKFYVINPTLRNFYDLFAALDSNTVPFSRYFFNSVFTTVMSVFGTVIVCSMGAYAIVKHRVPGSLIIYNVVVAALMFSKYVTQIQNYLIVNQLGMINTYWALIIPNLAIAYHFFLMRQFLQQVPENYLEAARIDGGGELYIFFRIVMPLAKPAWATLIVLSFVLYWNDFFSPLIFCTSQAMKTLPLAMRTIAGDATVQVGRIGAASAATFMTTLPVVVIYVAMQSKVIKTMAYSGIKA